MEMLMAMYRVIVIITQGVDMTMVFKFVIVNGRRRIYWIQRKSLWIIDLFVRMFFRLIITTNRRYVIIRCRMWRVRFMRSMMTSAASTIFFISTRSGWVLMSNWSTIIGGAIRSIYFCGCFRSMFSIWCRLICRISIFIKKCICWFRKYTGESIKKNSYKS